MSSILFFILFDYFYILTCNHNVNISVVVIDSTKVQLEKPQEEIFILAEQEANVAGPHILFVDNLPENIKAAQSRGWQTLLYNPADTETSNKKLRDILQTDR